MVRRGELVYGLVVAVDIENFSRLDTLTQSLVQARLSHVLTVAADNAGLDRTTWHRQPRGDGELAVLPPDADAAWVTAEFPHRIAAELKDRSGPPLRLRVAMHHGTLTGGDFGPVGDAPIVACRLLDARSTRRALAADPDCDLVVVISERLFRDVVLTRFHGLCAERFRPMQAWVKGTKYTGYLCVGSPRVGDPVEP